VFGHQSALKAVACKDCCVRGGRRWQSRQVCSAAVAQLSGLLRHKKAQLMTLEAKLIAAREAPIEANDSDVRPTHPRPSVQSEVAFADVV
jgi:hypothetical protein